MGTDRWNAAAARRYLARGWWPLPIYGRGKGTVPPGFTGYDGRPVTTEDIDGWGLQPAGNLCLHLRPDQVGIDVDMYRDDGGHWDRLVAELGPLPETVIVSARFGPDWDGSGIRLYRLPAEYAGRSGERGIWRRQLAASVDVVRFGHRQVVAWPSVHPKLGTEYRWTMGDSGPNATELPDPAALPFLPEPWCRALLKPHQEGTGRADDGADLWTEGEPCRAVTAALDALQAGLERGGRYDAMVGGQLRLARLGEQGHRGTAAALDALHVAYVVAVEDERDADSEWERALAGVRDELDRQGWTDPADRGCCDIRDDPGFREWTRNMNGDNGNGSLEARMMRDLPPAPPILWLAVGWIPRAAVTVLVGDEGLGKSLWWVRVAAAITTGSALPDIGLPAQDPQNVIVVITEDPRGEVEARLKLAGADLGRVALFSGGETFDEPPTFPDAFKQLAADATRIKPAAVFLDTWADTVTAGVKLKDGQQAGAQLRDWRNFATTFDAAVLLVAHTNRSADEGVRDRIGLTSELRKKARSLLYAMKSNDRLAIGPDKSNAAGLAPAQLYDVEPVQVRKPPTKDDPGTCARLISRGDWAGMTIADLLRQDTRERKAGKAPSAAEKAAEWLEAFLKAAGGSAPAVDALAKGKAANHSERALRDGLKLVGYATGGGGQPWTWVLDFAE